MTSNKYLLRLTLAAAALGGAVSSAAAQPARGPVLASELFYQDRAPKRLAQWTADPLLARYPALLRTLRTEGLRTARVTADECSDALPCNRILRDEFVFGGSRLVSLFSSASQFTGGAHGSYGVTGRIFDLRTGRTVAFRDLFTNWRRVQPILQTKVCAALRERREGGITTCPEVTELAFALDESGEIPVGGTASGFQVRTSDYQLGSYADGTEEAYVTLDAQLMGMIKPEYRADFHVPAN